MVIGRRRTLSCMQGRKSSVGDDARCRALLLGSPHYVSQHRRGTCLTSASDPIADRLPIVRPSHAGGPDLARSGPAIDPALWAKTFRAALEHAARSVRV